MKMKTVGYNKVQVEFLLLQIRDLFSKIIAEMTIVINVN